MARGICDGCPVCALNARDLTDQLAGILIDDHYARLTRDENAVVRWVGDDVIPAAFAT